MEGGLSAKEHLLMRRGLLVLPLFLPLPGLEVPDPLPGRPESCDSSDPNCTSAISKTLEMPTFDLPMVSSIWQKKLHFPDQRHTHSYSLHFYCQQADLFQISDNIIFVTKTDTLPTIEWSTGTDISSRSNCSIKYANSRLQKRLALREMKAPDIILHTSNCKDHLLKRNGHAIQAHNKRTKRIVGPFHNHNSLSKYLKRNAL